MNRIRLLRIATILLAAAGAVLAWLSWQQRAERLEQAERIAVLSAPPSGDSPIAQAFQPGQGETPPAPAVQVVPGGNLFAQAGTWRDQSGQEIKLAALAGRPVVFTFIYTTCTDACPTIVRSMQAALERVPPGLRERAQKVLVSIDSEKDSPPVLRDYAGKMGLPDGQWRLLTAPDEVVRAVADMVGFRYQRVGREFSHNAVIAVADARGEIVGWFADERIRDAELLGRGLAMALSM